MLNVLKKLYRLSILRYTQSHPIEDLIDMESRIRQVKSLIRKQSADVCMIGIWGMGGIGKTTIARAVYRQISYKFDGSSFVEDVRENGSDKKGLKSLQEKLLSEILLEKHYEVKDCDNGISQIRRRLGRKKVLVVLDDVDNRNQLEFLAGAHEWFGPGSRIIITTRDEHLLCYAQEKYAPKLLTETEAMKLFCRYAFKGNIPPKAYEKLSGVVVRHTGHLPLALKVLGSYFCGQNLDFWQSALNVLAKIPLKEINAILKVSFDGLTILEKKIFLEIACFFKGGEKRYVTRVLDSFGFEPVSGITVLIQKSLLTVSNGYLHMHDVIQEMGRSIVRECIPNNMVWAREQIEEVMTTIDRLDTVEAIVDMRFPFVGNARLMDLYCSEVIKIIKELGPIAENVVKACYSAQVFQSMKKLRLLHVCKDFTSSEPSIFPEELRWLCWVLYPFQSLRITRGMAKLVGLEMPYSDIEQLQIGEKVILTNLKILGLNGSYLIRSFPDVCGMPNLEHLNLSNCESLVKVHRSVLFHEKIIHLDLTGCRRLEVLPFSIQMKSLQTLFLNDCISLKRFPEVSREMKSLLVLRLDGCYMIRELPSSIKLFTGLILFSIGVIAFPEDLDQMFEQGDYMRTLPVNLHIHGFTHFTCLRILDLKHNDLVDDVFPRGVHNLWPSLEELNLRQNLFTLLPASISQLSRLKYIDLNNCINLKELPELPSLIQVLKANFCTSLEKIGDLSNKYMWLFKISLPHCLKFLDCESRRSHIANLQMKSFVQKCAAVNHRLSILVPGTQIPDWFRNQSLGHMITLKLPQSQITKIIGLAICCLIWPPKDMSTCLKIKFKPSDQREYKWSLAHSAEFVANRVWIGYMSTHIIQNLCHGFESEDFSISFESDIIIRKCGVCIIYKDDIKGMPRIGSWIPDYDESVKIDQYTTSSEDFLHGRWSKPTFFLDDEKTGELKAVGVWI